MNVNEIKDAFISILAILFGSFFAVAIGAILFKALLYWMEWLSL